jgi:hypothetical protein
MRRPLLVRVLTGFLGLWFAASMSGVALQACPEHGGVTPGMIAGAHHHGGPDCAGAAGQGPADAGGHDQTGTGHDCHHGHHGHQCTCPGSCCATGMVTLAAGRLVAIPVVPVSIAAPSRAPANDVRAVAAPDVVLPPPLGPPAFQV